MYFKSRLNILYVFLIVHLEVGGKRSTYKERLNKKKHILGFWQYLKKYELKFLGRNKSKGIIS